MKLIDQSIFLFDLSLVSSDVSSLLKQIETQLQLGKKPLIVFTPNPEQIVQSISDDSFGSNLRAGDLLIPDGIGLVWASKLLGFRTKRPSLDARVAGSDLVQAMLSLPAFFGNVLIVGGRDYKNRSLQLSTISYKVGAQPLFWTAGYKDVRVPSAIEEADIVALLEKLRPSIVFVAFGAPHQEAWIIEHRELLAKSGVRIVMSVGGAFDMLLGIVPRAPWWMQKIGLEWLFRLVRQPWRWRRQLRLLTFVGLVIREFIRPQSHL